jgi:hypothetical protein
LNKDGEMMEYLWFHQQQQQGCATVNIATKKRPHVELLLAMAVTIMAGTAKTVIPADSMVLCELAPL